MTKQVLFHTASGSSERPISLHSDWPILMGFFRTASRRALLAAFLALLGAISTLGYAWYRAAVTEMESASSKAASAAQKLKADRVKGLLAKALVSGDTLIRSHKDTDEDQAKKDAEKWGQQTHDLIAAAYGEGEAALFLDDSGYVFDSVPVPMNTIRNWIDGRMRRLTALLKRTDTLSTRTDFDPAKFE